MTFTLQIIRMGSSDQNVMQEKEVWFLCCNYMPVRLFVAEQELHVLIMCSKLLVSDFLSEVVEMELNFLTTLNASAGGKRAKGRGGGGNRGVRGVDFGLGIGYNPESKSTPSNAVPSRSAAVNSLKTGMMAQFRSSFVAASTGSQNAGMSNSSGMYANKKTVLPGFVSGGSIGGGIHTAQTSSSVNSTPPVYSGTSSQSRENASQKNSER